jgi:HSP20 family protein
MPLSPWESDYDFTWPMARLHQEMNRLFSDAVRGFGEGGEAGGEEWVFNPVVDVEQQDRHYEITVELPGVRPEDVNVEVQQDMLMISGSKERKQTSGEGENRRSERMYGSFRRAFRLPDDVRQDEIRASFNDGVLTVSVPREESRQQSQARRIEVQRGQAQGTTTGGEAPQQIGTGREGERPARH